MIKKIDYIKMSELPLPPSHHRDERIKLEDLPDISGDQPFYLEWHSGSTTTSGLEVRLYCKQVFKGDPQATKLFHQVIWRKKYTYETILTYIKDVPTLVEKYGDRLQDVKPSTATRIYFYGDVSSTTIDKYQKLRYRFDQTFDKPFMIEEDQSCQDCRGTKLGDLCVIHKIEQLEEKRDILLKNYLLETQIIEDELKSLRHTGRDSIISQYDQKIEQVKSAIKKRKKKQSEENQASKEELEHLFEKKRKFEEIMNN